MINLKRSEPAPPAYGLGGVAKSVGLVAIAGVAVAHALATATERGLLPHLSVVWPQPSAASRSATQISTIVRSVGVDGVTTSTITKPFRAETNVSSPCGEADAPRNGN